MGGGEGDSPPRLKRLGRKMDSFDLRFPPVSSGEGSGGGTYCSRDAPSTTSFASLFRRLRENDSRRGGFDVEGRGGVGGGEEANLGVGGGDEVKRDLVVAKGRIDPGAVPARLFARARGGGSAPLRSVSDEELEEGSAGGVES